MKVLISYIGVILDRCISKTIMHYIIHDPLHPNTQGGGKNTNSTKNVILRPILISKPLGQGHVSIEVEQLYGILNI